MKVRDIVKRLGIKEMFILSFGILFAQLFSYIVQPVITRIYSPEELGNSSLILSYISTFTPLVTLQYDQLIPVVKSEKESLGLLWLSIYLTFVLSILIGTAYIIYIYFLNSPVYECLGGWIILLIPGLVVAGFINIISAYNIRSGEYKLLSRVNITRSISQNALKVMLGIVSPVYINIILSTIIGSIAGIKKQISNINLNKAFYEKEERKLTNAFHLAKRYNKQIYFSTPGDFAINFAYSFLPNCIMVLYGNSEVGYFSLSVLMLGIPLKIISESVGKVFIQKASKEKNEQGSYHNTYINITILLALGSLFIFSILFIVIEPVFSIVFGYEWIRSAYLAKCLIPLYAIRFIETVLINSYIISNKQEVKMYLQLLFLVAISGNFFLCKSRNYSIDILLKGINCTYSFLYMVLWGIGYWMSKERGRNCSVRGIIMDSKNQYYNRLRHLYLDFLRAVDEFRYKQIPQVPQITEKTLKDLEAALLKYVDKTKIEYLQISKEDFCNFEKKLDFGNVYKKGAWRRYERKIAEYYLTYCLLHMEEWEDEKNIYIDVVAQNSPWAEWCNAQCRCNAYAMDLEYPHNYNGEEWFICADATCMPFNEDSIYAISMQSSLETFSGDSDIKFIEECSRVLKKGGKVIISPLYLNSKYCNLYGKTYYLSAEKESEAEKYLRLDHDIPFTRLYDIKHLKERILDPAVNAGLNYRIFIINSDLKLQDKRDTFVYLHFALELKKIV